MHPGRLFRWEKAEKREEGSLKCSVYNDVGKKVTKAFDLVPKIALKKQFK
jgi:hypothetical protein